MAELAGTVETLGTQGFDTARARIRSDRGTKLVEAVDQSINAMRPAEEALAQGRGDTAAARAKATLSALAAGSMVALGVLFATMHRINRNVWRRRQAERALREAYDTLDTRVEQRTADLALIHAELRGEVAERKRAEEQIREQAALLDHARDAISVPHLETESMALSRLLWGSLAPRLATDWKAKRLLIVASGALAYLPLGALPC